MGVGSGRQPPYNLAGSVEFTFSLYKLNVLTPPHSCYDRSFLNCGHPVEFEFFHDFYDFSLNFVTIL